jgi:hypothetical protein
MAKQPEVGPVAPTPGGSTDAFETVSEKNPMRFVSFYRREVMEGGSMTNVSSVLRPKAKVKVPASRACPDADKVRDGTPLCNFEGWSAEDSLVAKPPEVCPGTRWDGRPCGKLLILKNEAERYLHATEYQFEAKSPQQARFLASKFPRDTELADDYAAMGFNGSPTGVTYPGKGRTWREFLDNEILPTAKRWNYKAISGPKGMTVEVEAPRPQRA